MVQARGSNEEHSDESRGYKEERSDEGGYKRDVRVSLIIYPHELYLAGGELLIPFGWRVQSSTVVVQTCFYSSFLGWWPSYGALAVSARN